MNLAAYKASNCIWLSQVEKFGIFEALRNLLAAE